MNRRTRWLVGLAALPKKVYNRGINLLASALASRRITIDWTDARILNPAGVDFLGTFNAGRGLWLQAIGREGRIEFGDGAMLSDWVHVGAFGSIRIGRNVLIGSKVVIIDHDHGSLGAGFADECSVPPTKRPLVSKGAIHIGDNVWLGDNVVVLSGVSIGDGCVVGANSVVRTDLPAATVCAGIPARVIRNHSRVAHTSIGDARANGESAYAAFERPNSS